MRVFVTGGTGTIGSAVVAELLAGEHTVLGLARSDRSEEALRSAGADVVRGDMTNLDVLRDAATASDGVINLAFGISGEGPDALARAIAEENAAVGVLGDALRGTEKPIVTVAGTPQAEGRAATEQDSLSTVGPVAGRGVTINTLLGLAREGVRSSAVRMPRTAHIGGVGGFAGMLVDHARRTGVAGYPRYGLQRWPAVHVLDAAVLFRLALESAPGGTSWHAVADEGDRVRDIAEAIGRRLGMVAESVSMDVFGPLGPIFASDQPASSAYTRKALGWSPTHASLLEDLENLQR